MTESDKEKIKACEIFKDSIDYPLSAPHLFAENKFMSIFNEQIINNLSPEKVTVSCHDTVISPSMKLADQMKLISRLPQDPSQTANLHHSLDIVINMIYDLTVNVNTEDGLANGATCVLKHIDYRQAGILRPSIIWVQFDDPQIGVQRRLQYKRLYKKSIHESWTPVFDVERTFIYGRARNATIQRIQFPLVPAAGCSVHRAQGSTLNKVVIDLTQNKTRKVPHLHYVALSRVKSIKNLHILNFNEDALKFDEHVEAEMQRLYDHAVLDLCYVPLDTIDATSHFKIAYNNCRSLHKHVEDIRCDKSLLSAHIIGLSESRLCHMDDTNSYAIEGFTMIRNDQSLNNNVVRPPHGSVLYAKNGINISKSFSYSTKDLEFIVIESHHHLIDLQIVVVYKSPSTSYYTFSNIFEKVLIPRIDKMKPLVIIGDFNVSVTQSMNRIQEYMLRKLNCSQLNHKPTTDYGSTIDLVFTNCAGEVGTEEAYWSDHKLLYFFT